MKTCISAAQRRTRLLAWSVIICATTAVADGPEWWISRNVVNPSLASDDYGVLNLGQLKKMAAEARNHFNANLSGGAGTAVNDLVNGWSVATGAEDYGVCNVGQLKAVAQLYWDRLFAVIGGTTVYPWTATTTDDDDYSAANVGQLKKAFAFDSDQDGIDDVWEVQQNGNLTSLGGTDAQGYPKDSDGDGLSDGVEYQIGWNPSSNDLTNTAKTESLTYDGASRLTSVTGRSTLGYTPDANGNLTQTTP